MTSSTVASTPYSTASSVAYQGYSAPGHPTSSSSDVVAPPTGSRDNSPTTTPAVDGNSVVQCQYEPVSDDD